MRFLLTALILCSATAVGATELVRNGEQDPLANLNGSWEVKSIERDPPEKPGEGKGIRCEFKDGRVQVYLPDKDTPAGALTITVDATKKPMRMSLKPDGEQAALAAIYQLDGNELKVCWKSIEDKKPPTEFSAKRGNGQTVVSLTRKRPSAK